MDKKINNGDIFWLIYNEKIRKVFVNHQHNAIFIFTTKKKVQDYIRKINLAGATPYSMSWEEIVKAFANSNDLVVIDATGKRIEDVNFQILAQAEA